MSKPPPTSAAVQATVNGYEVLFTIYDDSPDGRVIIQRVQRMTCYLMRQGYGVTSLPMRRKRPKPPQPVMTLPESARQKRG